jgi:hypothetical protein
LKTTNLTKGENDATFKVNEIGNVNHLTAENLSFQYHVFIQSGDIVKGCKQDRTTGDSMQRCSQKSKIAGRGLKDFARRTTDAKEQ